MIVIFFFIILQHFVYSEDICNSINCGSGVCRTTENPTLPYYCQCLNGSNTLLPCPSENPCSRNPCGHGSCEVVPNLLYGYLCRCAGDTISLTSCNATRDSCGSNPCINGLCIEGITSFICNCLPTWTGRVCNEKIGSPCSRNLCGLGKCFKINDPSITYVCLCPNAQFGLSCQATTYPSTTARMLTTVTRSSGICNPLNSDNCMNGGKCLPTAKGYQCFCTSSVTGRFCETKISGCASNPCRNGADCYDFQSSYVCACLDGSFRAQCLPNAGIAVTVFLFDGILSFSVLSSTARALICPCQNGGICTMSGLQTCICSNGFTGQFCESLLFSNTCQQLQCMNGGTCYENSPSSMASASCLCKNGYTGKYCEIEYFRCQSNGRYTDRHNCATGKYFECVHYEQNAPNPHGLLLSRNCPVSLRFNVLVDRCDYPKNVQCN